MIYIVEEQCVCRVRGDPIVSSCDGQVLTLRNEGFFEIASGSGGGCPTFRVGAAHTHTRARTEGDRHNVS